MIFVIIVVIALAAGLSTVLDPSPAFAQTNAPPENVNPAPSGPSVGTLVAAAMETAGYASQSKVLSDLRPMLEKLGALIYLCCIISALMTVAVTGRYEVGLWLLVGPPLFFFLLKPGPSSAAGANWQFGPFHDQAGVRDKLLRGAGVSLGEGEEVSWFFHGYNVLISDTVQQLVGIVTAEDVRKQMMFMARQQVLDDMFAAEVTKPDLQALAKIVQTECSQEMNAARVIALGQRDAQFRNSAEYKEAVKEYCDLYDQKKKRITLAPGPARSYVVDIMRKDERTGEPDKLLSNVTCRDLWDVMYAGISELAGDALANSKNGRVNHQAPAEVYQKLERDIAAKLRSADKIDKLPDGSAFACTGAGGGAVNAPPPDGKEQIQMIFSAWMLRKMFAQDPRGHAIQQFAHNAGLQLQPMNYHNFQSREAGYEMVRRFRLDRLGEVTRFEAFTLAMTLPYVQGVGLYVLATLFPFFALMVLLPGQAGSFFMWCALWAWLKSWDIGWALVMVADEMLWSVMPHSSFFRMAGKNTAGSFADPVTVFEAAFDGDYGYNLTMYYLLVAAMISAVPVISANAVLGSKKAIAGFFVDGLKTMASNLATHVGDEISPHQLKYLDERRENSSGDYSIDRTIPHHVDIMLTRDRFQPGAVTGKGVLDAQKALIDPEKRRGDFINDVTDTILQANAGRFGNQFTIDDRRRIQRKVAEEVSRRLGNSAELMPQNRFVAMAEGLVYEHDKDGNRIQNADGSYKTKALGFEGALIETLRGMGASPEQVKKAAIETWHLSESVVNKFDLGKPADFVNEELRDPMTRTYTAVQTHEGKSLEEYQKYRRTIESLRASGDNLQGLAELVALKGVSGAATTYPVFGKFSAVFGAVSVSEANALWGAGVSYERMSSSLSADFAQKVGGEYYFQSGKSSEWQFWEQTRAGVSLRQEWWNVPGSHNIRPSAVLFSENAQAEALKYFGKAVVDVGAAATPLR